MLKNIMKFSSYKIECYMQKLTDTTHASPLCIFANKVYPDQTAPQELSYQGILYLPMCDPRTNIFPCINTQFMKVA